MSESVSLERLRRSPKLLVTAHRGASCDFPENTLLSMARAVEAGADFIEFDLRASSDGVPLLLHDETLDRTSNGHGRPEDLRLSEIKKLNGSYFIKFQRLERPCCEHLEIPTFEEILSEFRDRAAMNIQIYLGSPAALREACRLYRTYDMYDRGYFTIADEAVVRAVREIDPGIAICLTPGWHERAKVENLRRCAELGCGFVQPTRESVTPETFRFCSELGLRANVFFADTEADFFLLRKAGAPGIMTNRPAYLNEWLKQRSQSSVLA